MERFSLSSPETRNHIHEWLFQQALQVEGLMCIPPNDNKSEVYFSKMRKLSDQINLPELSMGMSDDYLKACEYKTTFFRIGSKIFGERN